MKMKLLILCFSLALFPVLSIADNAADDNPTAVIGEEAYDQKMCLQRFTNECINTVCQTSGERDCNEQCKAGAADKCPDTPIE